jgi:hypothetical protein
LAHRAEAENRVPVIVVTVENQLGELTCCPEP